MIGDAIEKIVEFCGFASSGGKSGRKKLERLIEKDTKGAIMLSDLLEYDFVDEESGIFFNSGGSNSSGSRAVSGAGGGNTAGFWFEISPLVGSEQGLEKNLTLFLNDELPCHGPEGGYLQFLIIASHKVDSVLDMWERGRVSGGAEIKKLTRYRRHFIEGLACDFGSSALDGRLVRNYRTFVSYSSKIGRTGSKLADVKNFQKKC